MRIVLTVLGVGLLLLILLMIRFAAVWIRCRRASESAEGTVTAVREKPFKDDLKQYWTEFSFEAAGRTYTGSMKYADTEPRFSVGEQITVRYHAKHPKCFYAVRDMSAYLRGLVAVLLAIVVIVPLLFLCDGLARYPLGFLTLSERKVIRIAVWSIFSALLIGLGVVALYAWHAMQTRGRDVTGEVLRTAAWNRQTLLIVGYEADGLQLITNLPAEKGQTYSPGDSIAFCVDRKCPQNVWTQQHMTLGKKIAFAAVFVFGALMLIVDFVQRIKEILQM